MTKTIVKALVGSRAHGLNKPDSDWDWRGVFIAPTSDIVLAPLGVNVKDTGWFEGSGDGKNKIDDTSYEIGHFLKLASNSNPSILELLASPHYEILTEEGKRLQELLPEMWSTTGVVNAFGGYAHNQVKKMLENKDGRRWSYAKHYLRTLIMGVELLENDNLTMVVPAHWQPLLIEVANGEKDLGHIINQGGLLNAKLEYAAEKRKGKETNIEKLREFLLEIRKANW